jgi:uncharacterized protein (TIGR02145 family)
MKVILSLFIALFLIANVAMSQDTLYVYKAGIVAYKSAINSVDSISFTYIKPSSGTVADNDGHTYSYKTIGTQTWMTENLRTSKYQNGESISNPTLATDWASTTLGAWCNYNNDVANDSKYGKLYNWYAVADARNIAPVGWHVASDAEWTTLTNYISANLGNSVSVAKALAATTDWSTETPFGTNTNILTIGNNLPINNSSGFSALPGGLRNFFGGANGTFSADYFIGYNGCWWSSTEVSAANAFNRGFGCTSSNINTDSSGKCSGCSVRCVRD